MSDNQEPVRKESEDNDPKEQKHEPQNNQQSQPEKEEEIHEQDVTSQPTKQEITIQNIINQAKNQEVIQVPQRKSAPIPVIVNPVYYYKGHQKYDWKLEEIEPSTFIELLDKQYDNLPDEQFGNQIEISVKETISQGSGMSKHNVYVTSGQDKNGQFSCKRRYSEYILFRNKLSEQWPGIFLPTLPNATFGCPEDQLIAKRIKFINDFWRMITFTAPVYYSNETQIFLRDPEINIQIFLTDLKPGKIPETLEKYKSAFSDQYQTSMRQQFMYRKNEIPVFMQNFENYFLKSKVVLNEYKDQFRKLIELKTKYFKAMNKLNQNLLPDYQNILTKWFTGAPIKQEELGIMQKNKQKEELLKKQKTGQQAATQEGKQQEMRENSHNSKEETKIEETVQTNLFGSEAFHSRLQDTAALIHNFNRPNQLIYDFMKFQLKDIDMVSLAIQQLRYISKDIDFLKRNIAGNKEQIQSLNNKKTTLKTFFMGGSQDDKKAKLSNQSQANQQKLQKIVELYNIMLVMMEQQLAEYHKRRVDQYRRNMTRAFNEDLSIARSVMEFQVYQTQLLGKERVRRVKELVGEIQPQDENQQEIKMQND